VSLIWLLRLKSKDFTTISFPNITNELKFNAAIKHMQQEIASFAFVRGNRRRSITKS
jgi:hypothetical protein